MFGDKRWYLFTLFGNKIYVTLSFLFILLVFAGLGVQNLQQLMVGLLWIPVLFIGVLLHELGHAAASRALGYGKSEIVFWGLGGMAINQYKGRRSSKHNILISLAGPGVSILLALVSAAVWFMLEGAFVSTNYFSKFWELMTIANSFWAIFNLLPIYPMDGGQAMSNALQIAMKDERRALKTTAIASMVMIVLALGFYSFVLRVRPDLFLLLLSGYFAYMNWQMLQRTQQRSLY